MEKLECTILCDRDGNCYGYQYPTNKELMDKINEIIDYINKGANNKPSQNEMEDDKFYLKGGF